MRNLILTNLTFKMCYLCPVVSKLWLVWILSWLELESGWTGYWILQRTRSNMVNFNNCEFPSLGSTQMCCTGLLGRCTRNDLKTFSITGGQCTAVQSGQKWHMRYCLELGEWRLKLLTTAVWWCPNNGSLCLESSMANIIDRDYFTAESCPKVVFFSPKLRQSWFSLAKRSNKTKVQKVWSSKMWTQAV